MPQTNMVIRGAVKNRTALGEIRVAQGSTLDISSTPRMMGMTDEE